MSNVRTLRPRDKRVARLRGRGRSIKVSIKVAPATGMYSQIPKLCCLTLETADYCTMTQVVLLRNGACVCTRR